MTLRMIILATALVLPLSSRGSPSVDITTLGAIGDGKTVNTRAIQEAVNQCAAQGGGTVVVPAGTFLTGAVELKSNITLSLGPGAVLRGGCIQLPRHLTPVPSPKGPGSKVGPPWVICRTGFRRPLVSRCWPGSARGWMRH